MSGAKGKSKSSIANPLERELRSAGKKVAKVAASETKLNWMEVLRQTFGIEPDSNKNAPASEKAHSQPVNQEAAQTGPKQYEIVNFLKHQDAAPKAQAEQAPKPRIEAAIDYHREIVKSRERASKSELNQMQRNIEQIKAELSKLIASSQVLKLEFAEVSVEQSTTNIGQYHINFFEWMLSVIRSARQKVEDSNAWLGTVKGKGAKKGYWGMFKKHGTTFGLSGERSVATQVG